MNLDELRTVQSKERQKDSLQHLRPSFYQEVADYIADLKAEREHAADAADDPFSAPEVGRLTDEIETAKDVVEAIYERRMGKLVKQASLAAAGMPADDEGLTAEESDLFDDLVGRIQTNKGRVLDVLEGAAGETAPDSSTESPDALEADSHADTEDESTRISPDDAPPIPPEDSDGETPATSDDGGVTAADVMGGEMPSVSEASESRTESGPGSDSDSSSHSPPPETSGQPDESDRVDPTPETNGDRDASTAQSPSGISDDDTESRRDGGSKTTEATEEEKAQPDTDVDRVTVRITRDVGSILGVDDREYTLANDDVVSLPSQNATPLVERDAAEPLQ